jgi:hypothetical protein
MSTPIPTPTPNEWQLCGIAYDVMHGGIIRESAGPFPLCRSRVETLLAELAKFAEAKIAHTGGEYEDTCGQ